MQANHKDTKYTVEDSQSMVSEPAAAYGTATHFRYDENKGHHVSMTFDVPDATDVESFRHMMLLYAKSILGSPSMVILMNKLDAIVKLSHDWDIYGTPAPSTYTVDIAKQLVSRFPETVLDNTDIEPSEWGGVSIRVILSKGITISIRILDSGITWYLKHGRKHEFHEEKRCSESVYQEIINTLSKVA